VFIITSLLRELGTRVFRTRGISNISLLEKRNTWRDLQDSRGLYLFSFIMPVNAVPSRHARARTMRAANCRVIRHDTHTRSNSTRSRAGNRAVESAN